MLCLPARRGDNVPSMPSCYVCMSSRTLYISFLLLQAMQMILCQFYSQHDIMGKDCCDKKVQKDCRELPCNEYYLFNCQADKCGVDCCRDNATCEHCVEENQLQHLHLAELAPTPVGHGCCVPSFPPVIQYNAQRYGRCAERRGPFASSNLCACEGEGAFGCQVSNASASRVCRYTPIAAQKLIEHRGDRSASGHIRMAKLHAVAKATGPLQHRNCTGGCNTFCPARSYPIIGGPAVNAVDVVKSTRAYCPQRFANQQRTSQFLLASSFTALRTMDPSKDPKCSCN